MVARAAKNTGGGMVAGALMVARVGSFYSSKMVPGGRMVADGRMVPGGEMVLCA
jgi:hypothetical protein